ncbi:MAG: DUF2141 domain-containing protein [Robiginitomaculum sp.]|nr:DUF2141 domain-containing protein [Robiginitomaculum sp.]
MNSKLFTAISFLALSFGALSLSTAAWASSDNQVTAQASSLAQTHSHTQAGQHVDMQMVPPVTQTTPNLASAPVMQRLVTTKFKDISEQYTGYEGKIPVIINPTSCGKNRLELSIDVDNVEKGEGSIVADLHDNIKENFLKGDKVLLRIRVTATEGRTSFCIPMRESGQYAIAFYHDKNDNKKFDKGFLGIPKEYFGMSNNPKFGLKSPDFEQAVFQMPATGAKLVINLRKASDIL